MSFITSPGVIVPPLTAGGVAYGTGSQAKVNSAGTAGTFLQSAGAGVPVWAAVSTSPGNSAIITNTSNGYGSTNTKIRRFTTTFLSVGADISYSDSATNGALFTINTSGFYFISYTDGISAIGPFFGVSKNSTQLSTDFANINYTNKLAQTEMYLAGGVSVAVMVARLIAGDLIRPHTDGTDANTGQNDNIFNIRRINSI
jgi:hypothetical protein